MSTGINSYQVDGTVKNIDWTLKVIEKQVIEEAYEKAKKYEGKVFPDWKATSISYRLGENACDSFKARVAKEFESEIKPALIDIIAEGRIRYFCHPLREGLIVALLKGKGS